MGVVAISVMWTIQFAHIFVPSAPGGSKWDLVTIGLVTFDEMFEIAILLESWVKGQTMILTSSTHKYKCTHYDNSYHHFLGKTLKTFHEIQCISISPYLTLP